MDYLMKKVKSVEDSKLLLKRVTKRVENWNKNKEGHFLVRY